MSAKKEKEHKHNPHVELDAELVRRQLAEIENQLNLLENKRIELEVIGNSLNELKGQKDKEVMVPIGSGVLMKGTILDDKKVLINVGANILVEKPLASTWPLGRFSNFFASLCHS
jgi:prefoldin alpha subunit